MAHKHRNFWLDFMAKIGAPIFAGTLVGCIVKGEVRAPHLVLLVVGMLFIYLGHRFEHHEA